MRRSRLDPRLRSLGSHLRKHLKEIREIVEALVHEVDRQTHLRVGDLNLIQFLLLQSDHRVEEVTSRACRHDAPRCP